MEKKIVPVTPIQFEIDFFVTTRPIGISSANERVESFTISLEATSYSDAQEQAFTILKTADSFEELMNALTTKTLNTKKGNVV